MEEICYICKKELESGYAELDYNGELKQFCASHPHPEEDK